MIETRKNKHKAGIIRTKRIIFALSIVLTVVLFNASSTYAESLFPFRLLGLEPAEGSTEVSSSIQLLIIITILALAPSIVIMMTAFTRIVIILSFMRNALGTQQMPPNQVIIGLALFLTFFIMRPVFADINENAIQPLEREEISQQTALDRSSLVIKKFMLSQIRDEKDLELFVNLGNIETPVEPEKLPITVIVPAFLMNELTIAFKMGFFIYIPFLVIDMVVASTLMSMGMLMLPPVMISLPFKILLFIMVGGWNLVVQSMIKSFAR
ncbi:MAG: flagellar type III secretion system pore protein FliP [Clostridiaceae bacterium]|nr:flagellar type III secretion system pore protein FliP [Clostridiaceae bacterium]